LLKALKDHTSSPKKKVLHAGRKKSWNRRFNRGKPEILVDNGKKKVD